MVLKFGMGKKIIYPVAYEHFKESIDSQIDEFIQQCYRSAYEELHPLQSIMKECALSLLEKEELTGESIREYLIKRRRELS